MDECNSFCLFCIQYSTTCRHSNLQQEDVLDSCLNGNANVHYNLVSSLHMMLLMFLDVAYNSEVSHIFFPIP